MTTNTEQQMYQDMVHDISELDDGELEQVQSQYGLLELLSRVHLTDRKEHFLNRDFTLSWTDPKIEEWANRQINIAHALYFNLEGANIKAAKAVRRLLMGEVMRRLTFTRSRDGRTFKAITTTKPETTQFDEKGLIKRFFSKSEKPPEAQP